MDSTTEGDEFDDLDELDDLDDPLLRLIAAAPPVPLGDAALVLVIGADGRRRVVDPVPQPEDEPSRPPARDEDPIARTGTSVAAGVHLTPEQRRAAASTSVPTLPPASRARRALATWLARVHAAITSGLLCELGCATTPHAALSS